MLTFRLLPVLALMFNAMVWGLSWWPFRRLEADGLHPLVSVVQPVSLGGGFLQAFDGGRGETRTFAVHRITSVALVDEDAPAG